jgi:ribosome-associated protein
MNNCREIKAEELDHIIIEGILEKKGKDIISIDLSGLDNSVCDSFIISHGDSGTQVRAIADHIEEKVKKQLNFNVLHKEGYENLQWILLDYNSVVVHIFDQDTRKYYQLEELWADGKCVRIIEEEFLEIKDERNG